MGLGTGVGLEAPGEAGRWVAARLGRPTGRQGGKGLGRANRPHRAQPPYRLANPLPYPLFRSESGTPGALRLPGLRRPRGMGLETCVDLEALAETGRWLAALLGRPTGSKVGKALAGV